MRLADFPGPLRGAEWVNPGCPFVQKHYASGNLPAQQGRPRARRRVAGVDSTAAITRTTCRRPNSRAGCARTRPPSSYDADGRRGRIGRAYGARTTPQMVAITAGVVVPASAIDGKASTRVADIAVATPYVRQALDEVLAGRPGQRRADRPVRLLGQICPRALRPRGRRAAGRARHRRGLLRPALGLGARKMVDRLAPHGYAFFLHAPKAATMLRRRWREPWTTPSSRRWPRSPSTAGRAACASAWA
ncbi:MAG: hypothetical protein U0527_06605 [Candidatus Eisenbacteria bacterium]